MSSVDRTGASDAVARRISEGKEAYFKRPKYRNEQFQDPKYHIAVEMPDLAEDPLRWVWTGLCGYKVNAQLAWGGNAYAVCRARRGDTCVTCIKKWKEMA